MPRPPRFPAPDRPDLVVRLLGAVAERDGFQALRLADQLVHRRGVGALVILLGQTLVQSQGEEARDWLAGMVDLPILETAAAPPPVQAPLGVDGHSEPGPSPLESQGSPGLLDGMVAGFEPPDPFDQAAWLQDLAREEDLLAGILADPIAAGAPLDNPFATIDLGASLITEPPLPPGAPEPLPQAQEQEPLIPRLMAVSPSAGSPRRVPAPAPAALARLRAWLHDDDALAEAS